MAAKASRQWSGKTGGSSLMQSILIGLSKVMPLGFMYGVIAVVIPFYMLINHAGYLATYHFFRHRLGHGRIGSFLRVYCNHYKFGQIVLDRFAAFGGKNYQIEICDNELFEERASAKKGMVMLGAHVGCFEMAGCILSSTKKAINVVVYDDETNTISKKRIETMAPHNMKMIPLRNDMSHLFLINTALERGEIVAMSADRANGSSKTVECNFMGEYASFPYGPFALARAKDIPVLAVFVMKVGRQKYKAYLRKVRTIQDYVCSLESVLRLYPLQWFNYYDFWGDGKNSKHQHNGSYTTKTTHLDGQPINNGIV